MSNINEYLYSGQVSTETRDKIIQHIRTINLLLFGIPREDKIEIINTVAETQITK